MSFQTTKILLIEDNPGDTRLLRERLRDESEQRYDLTCVETLNDGIQALRQQHFDVILLDLSLPDSLGVETLLRIRAEPSQAAIVVMTGSGDQSIGVQAVQAGAQDYLVKGETDEKLLRRAISYAIERQQIDEALRRSEEEYRSLINDVFDISTVAVLILDAQYKVVWINESAEVYFGIRREDVLGVDCRELVDTTLKCVVEKPEVFAKTLLDGYASNTTSANFECYITPTEDRAARWLEYWSQPIHSGMYAGGRIEQYNDVTERKLIEIAEHEHRMLAQALSDTAAALTSTLDLNEVLDRILDNIERVVPHDAANIMLLNGQQAEMVRSRARNEEGDSPEIAFMPRVRLADAPHLRQMFRSGQPTILDDIETQRASFFTQATLRAYAGVPIRLKNETIGFINIFSFAPGFFNAMAGERLLAFAGQAAIALQNARVFRQSQELATIEERQRLARELHDSVTQMLFTSSVMAESALKQWDKDQTRAHSLMADVHQLIASALAEMRILLLELHPSSLTQVTLKQLFEQLLRPLQKRKQLNMQVEIGDLPHLPPETQIALYRIVQEALNNILKHAAAKHITFKAVQQGNQLDLMISDDGYGFDPHEREGTSMGLNIMHERAAAVGAALNIDSVPGSGTQIRIRLPVGEFQNE